ncbi:jouberin-like isoform X2 [Agrilus planipennis]|uniref:Jouberin-like isoform X2 n=1 Tax=Agrilus planipennis TaxID=224129 RepID=A0A1W4WHI0_AGRPL|nr:jouberin-like isoform X2 [Agrilus planipennis]
MHRWNILQLVKDKILPHMSFVYCCAMITDKFIITGGYDKILRIWKKCGHDEFKLCQEIENHEGFITSVCVTADSESIYSCDSNGKVVEWTLRNEHHWNVNREIILAEIRGTIINQILLNDKETKLLIHARDSVLRLVDLKSLCILQRFTQALNNTVQTFCTFCNCSRYVFCSSENGFIHVWNVNNGHSVAKYMPYYSVGLYKDVEVHNVQFNPRKTQIAVASYNNEVPILLCGFDEQYKSFDLGLKYMPK